MARSDTVERATTLGVLLLIALGLWLMNRIGIVPLQLGAFSAAEIGQKLGPLFVTALFIERAVEVIMSTWRAQRAKLIEFERDLLPENQRAAKERELLEYKTSTMHLAFKLGFSLGLVFAVLGVRALAPFLADPALTGKDELQQRLFAGADMLMSATVLGGGADGIHKLMALLIDFFEKLRKDVAGAGGPARPAAGGAGSVAGHLHDPGA